MRTLKYRGYCLVELTADLKELPFCACFLHKTKREAIKDNTSYHGHPCDDPRKRGAVCLVRVTVEVPAMPKPSPELRDYVARFNGTPGLLDLVNEDYNRRAQRRANAELRRQLKKLDG